MIKLNKIHGVLILLGTYTINLIRYIFTLLSMVVVSSVFALEVDEKLTTRFLKISSSKKTILINRGLEDGLVKGDHGKFFLTTGVIARGVVIKATPSRSIWSLYRIIKKNEVIVDKVVTLKISSPIKLTNDPTKSSRAEHTEKMPNNLNDSDKLSAMEKVEVASLLEQQVPIIEAVDKNWEIWMTSSINNLSTEIRPSNSEQSTNSGVFNLSLGIEKYFSKESILNNFSILSSVFIQRSSLTIVQGDNISSNLIGFSGGVNWHFINSVNYTNHLIGFVGTNFGTGTVKDEVGTSVRNGSFIFYSLPIGLKYYMSNGFGLRVFGEYYSHLESYIIEGSDSKTEKQVTGPKFNIGISYRW